MDMKKILQALDNASSKPVEGSDDIKRSLEIMTEGANPHKVSLPVQMAMQHYQTAEPVKENKTSLLKKYVAEAEEELAEQEAIRQQRITMYSRKIAQKVLGESAVKEAPIDYNPQDPMNPMIHGHKKANPATLKSRINQARGQLKELADMSDSNDISVWQTITKRGLGGGWTMGLMQNLEQIQHGINELSALRKKGGVKSRGIEKMYEEDLVNPEDSVKMDIPLLIRLLEYAREDAKTDMDLHNVADMLINLSKEGKTLSMAQYDQIVGDQKLLPEPTNEACWKNYKQIGMKKKGKRMVPNCVPKGGK